MAFLNNSKFQEIRKAANEGNEKAKMVLQAMLKDSSQDDISRLADSYYGIDGRPVIEEPLNQIKQEPTPEEIPAMQPIQPNAGTEPVIEDLTEVLDKELDGIISSQEIGDTSFKDFLSNKRNDGLKAKKTADYFKAYDPQGRENYLSSKIDSYKGSFNGRLKDIDRSHRDMDGSLGRYSQSVAEMLDDNIELDMGTASKAYDEITDNHDMMLGLGRGHDNEDFNAVVNELNNLVNQYGKKNVIAALNTLRSDNNNYKDFRNNQINSEIERYSKNLEKLLK
jgi:hypothetical protein